MSKVRKLLVVGLGVLLLIGAFAVFKVFERKDKERLRSGQNLLSDKAPESIGNVLYKDESGFSFEYPSNLKVVDNTDEAGEEYYTRLLITEKSGDLGEIVRIEIKDTQYKSVEMWLKKDKEVPKGARLEGAVRLDEIEGMQYETEDGFFTAAVDQGALYLIAAVNSKIGREAYDTLVSSFAFVRPTQAQRSNASGSAGDEDGLVIYEEEEVVE